MMYTYQLPEDTLDLAQVCAIGKPYTNTTSGIVYCDVKFCNGGAYTLRLLDGYLDSVARHHSCNAGKPYAAYQLLVAAWETALKSKYEKATC